MLDAIAARPNQIIYGHIPFDNTFMKCASLLEGIIRWHPFTDGNKRTGLLTAISYLEINGYMLATPLDAIAFAVSVAEGRQPLHKIAL
jgi:death-on-curing protein